MAKHNNRTYKTGYYRGVSNTKKITCEDKICIPSIIKSYILTKDLYVSTSFQYWMELKRRLINICTSTAS